MKKVLYSGAWNADVWLQLFPMSLADHSFDWDGNCVCVRETGCPMGHTGLTVDRSLLLRDHIAEAVIRLTGLSPCSKFPTSHLFPHRKMFE